MSTLDAPSKVSTKRQDLREDRVITFYARAWNFFDKHRRAVYGGLAALVLLVVLGVAYTVYQNQQGEEARRLLGEVIGLYEQGNYQAALSGTGQVVGLQQIADEYGGSQAGNLARFYAADALYQLGEYDRALEYYQAFDKEENLLGASAYAGEAAIYENQENYEQAGERYEQAALFYANDVTSPEYLLYAGQAYEEAGAFQQAREAYQMINDRYPESQEAQQVDMYLARLEARAQSAS